MVTEMGYKETPAFSCLRILFNDRRTVELRYSCFISFPTDVPLSGRKSGGYQLCLTRHLHDSCARDRVQSVIIIWR